MNPRTRPQGNTHRRQNRYTVLMQTSVDTDLPPTESGVIQVILSESTRTNLSTLLPSLGRKGPVIHASSHVSVPGPSAFTQMTTRRGEVDTVSEFLLVSREGHGESSWPLIREDMWKSHRKRGPSPGLD